MSEKTATEILLLKAREHAEEQQRLLEAFDKWWYHEGSGMPPQPDEDHEEHVRRICKIAWLNGAFR